MSVEPRVRRVVAPQYPRGEKARLFIVGEAPGEDEALKGEPFVGASGRLLNRLLSEGGIEREDCYIGNVFRHRPPNNDVKFFFLGKSEANKTGWSLRCPHPAYESIGYVREEYLPHLDALKEDIRKFNPSVILALGNTAMWGLSGTNGIGKLRGATQNCTLVYGPKVIASYHPAAVLRQWDHLPTLFSDIQKTVHWNPELPERTCLIYPTIQDIKDWIAKHIASQSVEERQRHPISFDIETANDQITCIGFARKGEAIVVPFWSAKAPNKSYWATEEQELEAVALIASILEDETVAKTAQNGNYDIQWLLERLAIQTRGSIDDTMYMAHALQPEMRKGLGYLVSMYLHAPAWKNMVSHNKTTGNKADA